MINRYIVTETLLWKVQEIFPWGVSEKDQALLMLWSFLMFHRGEPVRNHIQVPASPPFRIHQTAKVSMLTETTLKQLEVLSEMVWLMSKPNKSSKRLKANIVDWTPSAVSVNLSLSELQPNQIQILRSGHESRRRYAHRHARVCSHAHGNAIHTGFRASLVFMHCSVSDVLGDAERQSGVWALRCSFVYPDGFQMLASDRSATERWGSSPAVWGLSQQARIKAALSGILEKTWLCFVITLQLFPKAKREREREKLLN